jgi:FixJ family two-component response regulator
MLRLANARLVACNVPQDHVANVASIRRPQLPVILITARDDDDVRQQALRDGAVDFMVKPFDAGMLWDNIARTMTPDWRI